VQILFTPKLVKISEKEGYSVSLVFLDELRENKFDPKKQTFFLKPRKKKEKICKAIIPVLTASP